MYEARLHKLDTQGMFVVRGHIDSGACAMLVMIVSNVDDMRDASLAEDTGRAVEIMILNVKEHVQEDHCLTLDQMVNLIKPFRVLEGMHCRHLNT